MIVRIDIFISSIECKSIEVVFKNNKEFSWFAKKVQKRMKKNEYITIGGTSEAYTLKTSNIINIHYEIIEKVGI